MVNETLTGETGKVVLSGITNYISYISIKLTEGISYIFNKIGINPSQRWSGMITLFFALSLIFISGKITKPFIKFALWVIGGIIILGLLIPW